MAVAFDKRCVVVFVVARALSFNNYCLGDYSLRIHNYTLLSHSCLIVAGTSALDEEEEDNYYQAKLGR